MVVLFCVASRRWCDRKRDTPFPPFFFLSAVLFLLIPLSVSAHHSTPDTIRIKLFSPIDGQVLSASTVEFWYLVASDSDEELSCRLYTTIESGTLSPTGGLEVVTADGVDQHSFIVSGIPDGTYQWTVFCIGSAGHWAIAPDLTFTIATDEAEPEDMGEDDEEDDPETEPELPGDSDNSPKVMLEAPADNAVIMGDVVHFTFSVTDEDTTVSCNLLLGQHEESLHPIGMITARTVPSFAHLLELRDGALLFPFHLWGLPGIGRGTVRLPGSPMASPLFVSGLSPDTYQWTVECIDSFGNHGRARERQFTTIPIMHPDTDEPPMNMTDPMTNMTNMTPPVERNDTNDSNVSPETPRVIAEDHDIPLGKGLFIKRIRLLGKLGLDDAVIGDDMLLDITLKNKNSRKLKGLHVALLLEDAGVRRMIGPFDLGGHDQISKSVLLDIPAGSISAGQQYPVRVTVSNDELRRVKHREINLLIGSS